MSTSDPVGQPEPAATMPPPYEPGPAPSQPAQPGAYPGQPSGPGGYPSQQAAPGGYAGQPSGPGGYPSQPAAPGGYAGQPGDQGSYAGPANGGGAHAAGATVAPETVARDVAAKAASFWWVFLITGVLWIIVAIVVLQLNANSVFVVGYAVAGILLAMGMQEVLIASAVEHLKWLRYGLGIFFLIGGIYALFNPAWTTASLAASLGWLFFLVGVFWIFDAIATRDESRLWLLGLGAGIVMVILAVWAGLQYSGTKLATLLIVAGIWALMRGVIDFVRAFQLKKLSGVLRSHA